MGTLSSAKTLGGVGSILILLFLIPAVGTVLAVIGWILVIVAVKSISDATGERGIFNNTLVSAILAIVGIAVGAAVVFGSFLSFAGLNGINILHMNSTTTITATSPGIVGLIIGVLIGLAVIWVSFLISAIFLRRAYDRISSRLNIKMFGTAALLYLIGAALTIIFIGLILIFVAEILQIIAFFSLPDEVPGQQPQPSYTVRPPPPSPAPAMAAGIERV